MTLDKTQSKMVLDMLLQWLVEKIVVAIITTLKHNLAQFLLVSRK